MRGCPRSLAPSRQRAGVTLIELVLATGLAAVIVGVIVTVSRTAMEIWSRAETSRDAREVAAVALGTIATDLRQLHPTAEGDVLVDWQGYDAERDGAIERLWPRLRFVRDASARELDAIARRAAARAADEAADAADAGPGTTGVPPGAAREAADLLAPAALAPGTFSPGLAEVLYAVVPMEDDGPGRFAGTLVRAERVHRAGTPPLFMSEDVFPRRGVFPADEAGAIELVTGLLWLEPLMATRMTRIRGAADEGDAPPWRVGPGLTSAATSWDAWGRGRPDADLTELNDPAPGMASPGERPLLPRSVRLSIEVMKPGLLGRAPTLRRPLDPEETVLDLTTTRTLLESRPTWVLVGPEWMRVGAISPRQDTVSVRRGGRGTAAVRHEIGTTVLFGEPASMEVPVPLYQDRWELDRVGAERGGAR